MCKIGRGIHKRKDGRYEARICIGRNPDGRYNYLYGIDFNLAAAKDKLQIRLVEHEREQSEKLRHNALFSTITEKWLDVYGRIRKTSTVAKYTDYCNCYILPVLGDKNISDITNMDITALYCKLTNDAEGLYLSRNTIKSVMQVLNLIKNYAQSIGYKVNFMPTSIDIKTRPNDIRALDKEEQRKLCRYLLNNPSPINTGIYLAYRTGIRVGELCGLMWDDISLDGEKMHIERTLQRIRDTDWKNSEGIDIIDNDDDANNDEKYTGKAKCKTKILIGAPKSDKSRRTIPLSRELCEILRDFYRPGTYFLTCNEKYIEPRMVQYHFKRILQKCDIEPVKFHILRHTFATTSIEAGVDVKCLSAILGHSSVRVTLDIYVHPTLEMKLKSMAKIGKA